MIRSKVAVINSSEAVCPVLFRLSWLFKLRKENDQVAMVAPAGKEETREAPSADRPEAASDIPDGRDDWVDGRAGHGVAPRNASDRARVMERILCVHAGVVATPRADRRLAHGKDDVRPVIQITSKGMPETFP